jgi:hypothetical protein
MASIIYIKCMYRKLFSDFKKFKSYRAWAAWHCPGLGPSIHIHESRDLTLSKHVRGYPVPYPRGFGYHARGFKRVWFSIRLITADMVLIVRSADMGTWEVGTGHNAIQASRNLTSVKQSIFAPCYQLCEIKIHRIQVIQLILTF